MKVINTHEAKTHFSRLLMAAARGREVVIGRHGTPVAKLIPFQTRWLKRHGGQLKGQIKVSKGFDVLPKVFLKHFVGKRHVSP